GNSFVATCDRVENCSHGSANNEVRAQVVDSVGTQNPILDKFTLDTQVELLHHGILSAVIDDIHPFGRASPWNNEPGERISHRGRTGNEVPRVIEIVDAAQAHVDGQSPAVQATLQ